MYQVLPPPRLQPGGGCEGRVLSQPLLLVLGGAAVLTRGHGEDEVGCICGARRSGRGSCDERLGLHLDGRCAGTASPQQREGPAAAKG